MRYVRLFKRLVLQTVDEPFKARLSVPSAGHEKYVLPLGAQSTVHLSQRSWISGGLLTLSVSLLTSCVQIYRSMAIPYEVRTRVSFFLPGL